MSAQSVGVVGAAGDNFGRWLSFAVAEKYTGINARTLRTMVDRGVIHVHRPSPGRVLLDRQEIDRVFSASAVTPGAGGSIAPGA